MELTDDASLVDRARAGDRESFDILAERYRAASGRLAFRLVRREDLAQELVQEALLQAWVSLNKLRQPARFRGWLYGIVLNTGRGYLGEQKGISLDAVLEGVQPSSLVSFDTPESLAERNEQGRLVLETVMSLAPVDRDLLLLFYWAELSVAEIAVMRRRSAGTVKVGLHRARKRLKTCLTIRHPEIIPAPGRRQIMIRVTIADIIKQEGTAANGQTKSMYILMLLDQAGDRVLPIWVGEREGQIIAMGLREFSFSRPMPHDFILDLLGTVKADIEEVRVQVLKGDTFYAVVKIRSGKVVSEMDSRPSDAIALAVRAGKPVYVAEDIMERNAVGVPDGMKADGRGIEAILADVTREAAEFRQKPRFSAADIRKMQDEVVKAAFG